MMICALSLAILSGCKPRVSSPPESTTSNTVRVMFPEGTTVSQIAFMLEENGVCSASDFMAEANNPLNLEGFSFVIPNPEERAFLLEGYLFPDTYEFYKNESASSAIKRFLKNTQSIKIQFHITPFFRCVTTICIRFYRIVTRFKEEFNTFKWITILIINTSGYLTIR